MAPGLFIYRGATPPEDPSRWTFLAVTSTTKLTIPFEGSDAERVWLRGMWYSATAETSNAGEPLCLNLPAAQSSFGKLSMAIAA